MDDSICPSALDTSELRDQYRNPSDTSFASVVMRFVDSLSLRILMLDVEDRGVFAEVLLALVNGDGTFSGSNASIARFCDLSLPKYRKAKAQFGETRVVRVLEPSGLKLSASDAERAHLRRWFAGLAAEMSELRSLELKGFYLTALLIMADGDGILPQDEGLASSKFTVDVRTYRRLLKEITRTHLIGWNEGGLTNWRAGLIRQAAGLPMRPGCEVAVHVALTAGRIPDDLVRIADPLENMRHVYVISSSAGCVKVGTAREPKKRIATLQTSSAFELEIAYLTLPRDDADTVERRAHKLLEPRRMSGEWFSVDVETAVRAINIAIGAGASHVPA